MKKTLMLLISTLLVTQLNAQKNYRIVGQLTNQNNETITLSYYEGSQLVEKTVTASKGAFELSGPAPTQPTVVRLNTSVDRNLYLGEAKTSMFMPAPPLELVVSEGCNLTVSGDAMNLHLAIVGGDKINEAFNRFHQLEAPLTKRMDEQRNYFSQAKNMGLTEELPQIGQKMLDIRTASTAFRKKFIAENPSEFISSWLLMMTAKDYTLTELKAAYEALTESDRNTSYGLKVAEQIKEKVSTEKTTK